MLFNTHFVDAGKANSMLCCIKGIKSTFPCISALEVSIYNTYGDTNDNNKERTKCLTLIKFSSFGFILPMTCSRKTKVDIRSCHLWKRVVNSAKTVKLS